MNGDGFQDIVTERANGGGRTFFQRFACFYVTVKCCANLQHYFQVPVHLNPVSLPWPETAKGSFGFTRNSTF